MAKIRRIEPGMPSCGKKLKVAAYVRVSSDTERLSRSFRAQTDYYNRLIQSNPEWEYAGVYADLGVSGTRITKREEFKRLLADCQAGKIDIVLTKSISRFARNTLDLLTAVRHLKDIGVEVRFEKEGIRSLTGEGELMLSILASFAQEESRSISENTKWGIRKRYQAGEIREKNKSVLGYRYDGEKYVRKEDEADLVRFIFEQAAQGRTLSEIRNALDVCGARTGKGRSFSTGSIRAVLKNEIYIGDRLLQKYFVEDPIKHNKVKNRGKLPRYYVSECHEPVIDRETFRKVQDILRKRADAVFVYSFTKKIECGICGRRFTRKSQRVGERIYCYWICRAKKEAGTTCANVNWREDRLERISARLLGMEEFDGPAFERRIRKIVVQGDGSLLYHFYEGRVELWREM